MKNNAIDYRRISWFIPPRYRRLLEIYLCILSPRENDESTRRQHFSRRVNFPGKTVSDSYHTYDRPEAIYSIANVHLRSVTIKK